MSFAITAPDLMVAATDLTGIGCCPRPLMRYRRNWRKFAVRRRPCSSWGAGWLITNASLTTCSPSGQKQLPGLFEHLSAAASAVVGGDEVIADHQREGQNATGFDLVGV